MFEVFCDNVESQRNVFRRSLAYLFGLLSGHLLVGSSGSLSHSVVKNCPAKCSHKHDLQKDLEDKPLKLTTCVRLSAVLPEAWGSPNIANVVAQIEFLGTQLSDKKTCGIFCFLGSEGNVCGDDSFRLRGLI